MLVHEDHRAPTVVSQIWYRVGSSYEPRGRTGISHALEHMMFKGTVRHSAGAFSRMIAARGGRENAFTGSDYTAYFQQLDRADLALAFELESDRMRNLVLDPQEFAREIRVVMEERRLRTEDEPRALADEAGRATAFASSPYRQPIIGWAEDLARMDVGRLRDWYGRWYRPSNAVLVVAGDVEPQSVLTLAREHFAGLPTLPAPRPPAAAEPPQHGPKRVTLSVPAQLPYLSLLHKVPVLADARARPAEVTEWEPYALELLAAILGAGDGARLPRTLVRETGLAAEVAVDYEPYSRLSTLFSIDVVPARGQGTAQVEARILAEIARVGELAVEPAELERARTRLIAERLYLQDSVFYQAMEIGLLETAGLGWRTRERYEGALGAVSAEQVRAVAARHLGANSRTTVVLEPK